MVTESKAELRRKIEAIAADQGVQTRGNETATQLSARVRESMKLRTCTKDDLKLAFQMTLRVEVLLAEQPEGEVVAFYMTPQGIREPTGEDWEECRQEHCPAGVLLTPVNALTMQRKLTESVEREKAYLEQLRAAQRGLLWTAGLFLLAFLLALAGWWL